MNKKLRQQVYEKFGGKCAYTGLPLPEDWQVDHITSKSVSRQVLVQPSYWKCRLTGNTMSYEMYEKVGSAMIMNGDRHTEEWAIFRNYKYVPAKYKPAPENNHIDNLVPTLRIVNHYKRELDLEGFRHYMLNFHKRLAKLPKNTSVQRTKERKIYMYKIAEVFGISPENPFSGVFYFETLTLC